MTVLSHDQAASLLGAYALDAVDLDERAMIADHLRECPRCRAEVAEHQEVAARLAFGGSTAPPGLWSKVAESLSAPAPSSLPRLYAVPPPSRRWWQMAAAAAVLVAMGALGWQVHVEQDKVRTISAEVAPTQLQRQMTQLSLDPSSTVAELSSADHHVLVNVVIGANGAGYLATNGSLPALAAGNTYQLWGLSKSRTVSLGLLGGNPGVVAFASATADMTGMAVTAEPGGGTVAPTGTPVAFGTIRRT
jgi:hypothetical protein